MYRLYVKTGQVVFDKIMNLHSKTEDNQRKSTDSNRCTESLRRPFIPFNKSPTAIYMCSPTFIKVLQTELLLSKHVNINATCYMFYPHIKICNSYEIIIFIKRNNEQNFICILSFHFMVPYKPNKLIIIQLIISANYLYVQITKYL